MCPDSLTTFFSVSLSKNVIDSTVHGIASTLTLVAGIPGKKDYTIQHIYN